MLKKIVFLGSLLSFLWVFPVCVLAEENTISLEFDLKNIITGDTPSTDETFEFILSAEDDDTPMPEDSNTDDIFIVGSGEGNFGIIYYDTPGEYHYEVSEVTGTNDLYSYDQTIYEIVVYVYLSNDELCAMVYVYEEDLTEKSEAIIFENTYNDPNEGNSSTTTTTTTATVVDTGDTNDIGLAVGLMVVSVLGIIVIIFHKNKRK